MTVTEKETYIETAQSECLNIWNRCLCDCYNLDCNDFMVEVTIKTKEDKVNNINTKESNEQGFSYTKDNWVSWKQRPPRTPKLENKDPPIQPHSSRGSLLLVPREQERESDLGMSRREPCSGNKVTPNFFLLLFLGGTPLSRRFSPLWKNNLFLRESDSCNFFICITESEKFDKLTTELYSPQPSTLSFFPFHPP